MSDTTDSKAQRFSFTDEEKEFRNKLLTDLIETVVFAQIGPARPQPDYDHVGMAYMRPDGSESHEVKVPVAPTPTSGPVVLLDETETSLTITVQLREDAHMGIAIGPNKCNIVGVLNVIRMQQIRPHNKKVVVVLENPSGKSESFVDDHRFGGARNISSDDFYLRTGIPAPHVKVRRSQSRVDNRPVIRPPVKEDRPTEADVRKNLIDKLKYELKADTGIYNLETATTDQLREIVEDLRNRKSAKLRNSK